MKKPRKHRRPQAWKMAVMMGVFAVALYWLLLQEVAGDLKLKDQLLAQTKQIAELKDQLRAAEVGKDLFARLVFKNDFLDEHAGKLSRTLDVIWSVSQDEGISPKLTTSIVGQESAFDPLAVSTTGDYGLMQINYSTWRKKLGIDLGRIFESEYNLRLGLKVLKHYAEESDGDMRVAVAKYNGGPVNPNFTYADGVMGQPSRMRGVLSKIVQK